jgi:UDP-glucuronate decarboxylase
MNDSMKYKWNSILKEDMEYIISNAKKELTFLSNRKVLFTGGCGFIGYYFYNVIYFWNQKFKKKKIDYTILDNSKTKPTWVNKKYCNFINKNIADLKNSFFKKYEIIIHGASIASPTFYRKYPINTMKANVLGLWKILESLKNNNNNKTLFFFSSSEVYGDPSKKFVPTDENYTGNVSFTGPRACYDESKRFGETLVTNYSKFYNFKSIIVRPFNNYGPGMKLDDKRVLPDIMGNIINNKNITLYSDGTPKRTFCYITDAIIGYLKALNSKKKENIYNIGAEGPEISMKVLAKIALKVSKNIIFFNKKIIFKKNNEKNYLTDNPDRRCPNMKKSKKELKFRTKVKLEEGLSKLLIYYLKFKK